MLALTEIHGYDGPGKSSSINVNLGDTSALKGLEDNSALEGVKGYFNGMRRRLTSSERASRKRLYDLLRMIRANSTEQN